MRLPGFENTKHDDKPLCRIYEVNSDTNYKHTFAELRAIVPKPQPKPPPESRTAATGATYPHASGNDAGRHWLDKALARVVPHGGENGRNNTGLWLAAQLRDAGLSQREAEPFMREYQQRAPTGEDFYTEAAAMRTLKSAYSRPPRPPAQSLNSGGKREPKEIKSAFQRQHPQIKAKAQKARKIQPIVIDVPVTAKARDAGRQQGEASSAAADTSVGPAPQKQKLRIVMMAPTMHGYRKRGVA